MAATILTATESKNLQVAEAAAGRTVAVSVESLNKAQLAAHVKATLGYDAPKSWSKAKMMEALNGDRSPRSGKAKAQLQAAYTKATGMQPAKSWTCAKLVKAVESTKTDTPIAPRGKGSKAEAVALYIKATGYQPAKSWTIAQIVANTKSGKLARNAVKA